MIPKVSILVPVYNASQWLRQCINSIVGQTYRCLQVVLVDDGSTDDSLAICKEYAEQYPFVEVYHQENRGVAAARNMLLDKASGDYVLFVDSDDWIEREMIEILMHIQQSSQCDVVKCEMKMRNSYDYVKSDNSRIVHSQLTTEDCIKEFLRHTNFRGSLCDKLIKIGLFNNKRINGVIHYGEDALLVWDIIKSSKKICTTTQVLYNYNRQNDSSISALSFNVKKMSALNVWQKICADVEINYPQYIDIAKARYGVEAVCLLYNAMRTNPDDDNVQILRDTIRDLLPYMKRSDFVSAKMYLFAWVAVRSCRLAKLFV